MRSTLPVMTLLLAIFFSLLVFACSAFASENDFVAVAYIQNNVGTLMLRKQTAGCPKGARQAVLISRDKPIVYTGCWTIVNGTVHIALEDGSDASFDAEGFVWVNGRKDI